MRKHESQSPRFHSLTLQMFWGHSPKRRYVTLFPERAKWKNPFSVTTRAQYNGRAGRAEKQSRVPGALGPGIPKL